MVNKTLMGVCLLNLSHIPGALTQRCSSNSWLRSVSHSVRFPPHWKPFKMTSRQAGVADRMVSITIEMNQVKIAVHC